MPEQTTVKLATIAAPTSAIDAIRGHLAVIKAARTHGPYHPVKLAKAECELLDAIEKIMDFSDALSTRQ